MRNDNKTLEERTKEEEEKRTKEDNEKIQLLIKKLKKIVYLTIIMSSGGQYWSDDPEKHKAQIIFELVEEGYETDLKTLEDKLSSKIQDYTSKAKVIFREDELLGVKPDKEEKPGIKVRKIIIEPFKNIGNASYKRKLTDKIIEKMVEGVNTYTQTSSDSKSDTTMDLPIPTNNEKKE